MNSYPPSPPTGGYGGRSGLLILKKILNYLSSEKTAIFNT